MNVQLPDGRVLENIPDGTTRTEIASRLKAGGFDVPSDWMGDASKPALARPRAQVAPKAVEEDDSVSRFTSGNLNKGIAGLAGLPVDTASNVMNLGIAGYGAAKGAMGGKPPDLLPPPVGGSQWIENLMRQGGLVTPGADPTSGGGRVAAGALQAIPGAMFGARTAGQMPRALSAGATSGAGAEVGKMLAPEGQEAIGAQIGALLPGARRTGAAPTPQQRGAQEARTEAFGQASERGIPVPPREMRRDPQQEKAVAPLLKELGMPPDTQLSPQVLQNYKTAMYRQGYEPIVKDPALGGVIKNDVAYGFRAEVKKLAVGERKLRDEFQNSVRDAGFQLQLSDFIKPEFTTDGAMKMIQQFRESANRNLSAPSATNEQVRMGLNQRHLALALEKLFEKNVEATGNKQLMTDFRDARMKIAQASNIIDSINPATGKVDTAKLAALGADKPFTGELKAVADIARAFPGATKSPSTKDDLFTQRVTPMAVTHPAAMGAHWLTRLADPIRNSPPYQSFSVDPRNKLSQGNEQLIRLLLGAQSGQAPPFQQ